ncbi:hypothetical protein FA15DRAFT_167340 [Coprinopsis marcescibilis]|uniref:Uncharacterized protein n=1 Tax=Coprinopsis marcescibilis TaxID=230819 RepID=A0A5C3KI43_COPMA|nr:hypothetical protein FA15DRAFT_167340 [Coprinopsis marcescibilis]
MTFHRVHGSSDNISSMLKEPRTPLGARKAQGKIQAAQGHSPALATTKTSNNPDRDALRILQSLKALGAPGISDTDFVRLNQGAFGEILAFVAHHVRGREGTREARLKLENQTRYPAEQNRYQIPRRHGVGATVDEQVANAASLLKSSVEEVEATLKAAEDAEVRMKDLQHQHDRLQKEVAAKRKADLLLDVLEQRETIRQARMDELGGLMQRLKIAIGSKEPVNVDGVSSTNWVVSKDGGAKTNQSHVTAGTLAVRS